MAALKRTYTFSLSFHFIKNTRTNGVQAVVLADSVLFKCESNRTEVRPTSATRNKFCWILHVPFRPKISLFEMELAQLPASVTN